MLDVFYIFAGRFSVDHVTEIHLIYVSELI